MNERIKELYTQALENKFDYGGGRGVKPGEYYSNYKTVLNAEKFAELIVQECVRYFNEDYERDFDTLWREDLSRGIKQHFGVEE